VTEKHMVEWLRESWTEGQVLFWRNEEWWF